METTKIALDIDLDCFLSQAELDVLPFGSSETRKNYAKDFLLACKQGGGSPIYIGEKDTYFPDPISMTEQDMEEYIDFWVAEQERTMLEDDENYQSRDEIADGVYDAALQVPELIVKKTLARIKKAEAQQNA